MEKLPEKNRDVIGVPDGLLLRPTLFAIFDNVNDELTLAAPVYPQRRRSPPRRAWEAAQARLAEAEAALERPLPRPAPPVMLPDPPAPASNFTKEEFLAAVARCKEYIVAGDAFQIVLSQRFSVPFALPPFSLYRALRRINPAPFLFYLDFGGFAVVGSQPGGAGAAARRHGDDPAAGRHAPARRDATRRTRRWRPNCWPIRRSGPST